MQHLTDLDSLQASSQTLRKHKKAAASLLTSAHCLVTHFGQRLLPRNHLSFVSICWFVWTTRVCVRRSWLCSSCNCGAQLRDKPKVCWPNEKQALTVSFGLCPADFALVRSYYTIAMEWNFFSAAGAVFLGYYSLNLFLQIVHGIRAFVLPALGVRKNLRKLGEWAGKDRWRARLRKVQFDIYVFLSLQTFLRLFLFYGWLYL